MSNRFLDILIPDYFFSINSVVLSFVLALLLVLISEKLIIIPILLLILLLICNPNYILPGIIILYLSITSEFFEQYRIYITALLTLLLCFLFIKKFGFRFKDYTKVPRIVNLFVILLFFSLSIASIFSFQLLASLFATIRMFLFFIIVYLFYALGQDKKNLYLYMYSLIGVAVTLGFLMMIDLYNLGFENFFTRSILLDKTDLYASSGFTGLTIFFISLSLIVALFFLISNKTFWSKAFLIILLFNNILVIILASSRGGILAAIISISFILFILNKKLLIKLWSIIVGIFLLVFWVSPVIYESINLYLRWETLDQREAYWEMGIEMIKDHPIFGIGPAHFQNYFYSYASSTHLEMFRLTSSNHDTPHAHNFFLYFFAENGILGLLSVIIFFVLFFYLAFKTLKLTKNRHREYYILITTITGIGIGIFFRSFIEITGYLTYGFLTLDLPFWLLFGILISVYQRFSKNEEFIN